MQSTDPQARNRPNRLAVTVRRRGRRLETAWDDNFAHAGAALQPAAGRFVFVRRALDMSVSRTEHLVVIPGAAGRRLLRHQRYAVTLRLWATFTALHGRACSAAFYGLHPGRETWQNVRRRCQG
jgi:hypothetical protein